MNKKPDHSFKKLNPFHLLHLASLRGKIIRRSSSQLRDEMPINQFASRLHPVSQHLIVSDIIEENADVRSYLLSPNPAAGTEHLAYFQAGQYLSVQVEVDGKIFSRPYSLSSAPEDALSDQYRITVKRVPHGTVSNAILDHWQIGSEICTSGPLGTFTYEPLRDAPHIVGIAGGSGITPFLSLAHAIASGDEDCDLTLFYGSRTASEILFRDELNKLTAACSRIHVIHVLSDDPESNEYTAPTDGGTTCHASVDGSTSCHSSVDGSTSCHASSDGSTTCHASVDGCSVTPSNVPVIEHGFITADRIRRYVTDSIFSIFICGPEKMVEFFDQEFLHLGLEPKYYRHEVHGEVLDPTIFTDYPKTVPDEVAITVHIHGRRRVITAPARNSLLQILENAGVAPLSGCRGGECGFCRARLISGQVFTPAQMDHRREADGAFGYIHPCCTYPLTDLEIAVTDLPDPNHLSQKSIPYIE